MEPDVIPAQKVISHLPTFRWHRETIRMKKSDLVNTAVTH